MDESESKGKGNKRNMEGNEQTITDKSKDKSKEIKREINGKYNEMKRTMKEYGKELHGNESKGTANKRRKTTNGRT